MQRPIIVVDDVAVEIIAHHTVGHRDGLRGDRRPTDVFHDPGVGEDDLVAGRVAAALSGKKAEVIAHPAVRNQGQSSQRTRRAARDGLDKSHRRPANADPAR